MVRYTYHISVQITELFYGTEYLYLMHRAFQYTFELFVQVHRYSFTCCFHTKKNSVKMTFVCNVYDMKMQLFSDFATEKKGQDCGNFWNGKIIYVAQG